ncbi:S9 family peptidase [Aquimarina sp. ERC-38]|uniref:S9 family peptidase n=1 Tax=Aquimarina sp. ERC-38 TaxID=2949996 RepID=UPI002245AEAE|nr:S9 family peptidase [Aquimarina sp. ERC-38]UZO79418.1 S9 family peptidase [Aquimarina sp. ERC-38]
MRKLIYTLAIMFMITTFVQAQDITGAWKGTLTVQGTDIPLIFKIEEKDKVMSATMDSPSQGATGIPVDKVLFENNQLTLSVPTAGIKYVGELKEKQLTGTFYQGGMELPLKLEKSEITLPGDPSLVTPETELLEIAALDKGDYKYKVEDYFAKPKARTFQLSPDGIYLSYREKDDKLKNHVYVKNTTTGEVKKVIEEKDELIRGYGWANKGKLIYVMDKGGNEDYHLFAVNIDGSDNKELTPFEGVKVNILALLKEDKDHMIISMNKNNPQNFEPYKININTGAIELLYENKDLVNPITDYTFTKDGELKAFTKLRDGVFVDHYYQQEDGSYKIIKKLNWKDSFGIINFNYTSENKDDAYVVSNLDSDKTEIYLYNLKEDKPIKKLFANDQYDISNISLSRNRNYELDYYSYEGDKEIIVPVSAYYKKLHDRITKEFPQYSYSIIDRTDNEDQFLLHFQSDKKYGVYYLYNVEKDAFTLLYDLMPQLREEDMAEMKPITFTSRDGIVLHGYITLPKNMAKGEKVPVIVNPHGGPQGIRDSWGFNPEAQLFASRNYATLHVNFRISGGYGRKFLESGFKQIGRKAMDDVEDGLQYIIDQGWVDPERVAIYGGSHGGYAVLRGLTKTPDLYTCGVDYVGVSNIFTFMKTIPPYWKPYLKIIKEVWYDEDVPEEKEIIKEVSPVYQIDKIKKPLLVIQGANDPRVNIDESDQIVKALRAKGFDVPYIVAYDEGHGFGKEENSIPMYKTMMGFYAEHLKKKPKNEKVKGQ